jgi:hypothetical protein
MKRDFSNLDGEVVNFDVMPGGATVKENYLDQDNFYPASGDPYATFDELPSFSNASGRGRARRQQRRDTRQTRKQDKNTRKNTRVESKAAAREMRGTAAMTRAEAKRGTAESQGRLAETLGSEAPVSNRSQEQLVAAQSTVNNTPAAALDKKGLSTNAKIGIAVGAVVLIGVVYMMTKGKNSGK